MCGFETSLQSCSAVVGPLLDVFGHLLSPNDEGVGWCKQDGVVVYMHLEWIYSIYSDFWMQPALRRLTHLLSPSDKKTDSLHFWDIVYRCKHLSVVNYGTMTI